MTSVRITSEPGTISAATIGKAAEDGSAGTTTGAGTSSGSPFKRDLAAVRALGFDPDIGAEMREQPLGVVAARFALDHDGFARRREPGQQHRRLDLGRGHRRAIDDRDRIARARERDRQPAAVAALTACAPISATGSRIRCIGRLRRLASPSKVAVMGQPATAPMTRRQPVPELPKSSTPSRRAEAADADAVDAPGALAGPLDRGAQRPHGLGGVDHVLAFEQPGDAGLADRERAEDQGAVRDRLVAGHAHAALERRPSGAR